MAVKRTERETDHLTILRARFAVAHATDPPIHAQDFLISPDRKLASFLLVPSRCASAAPGPSSKWTHTHTVLLCPPCFSWHHVFKVHPRCAPCQNFLPFERRITLHGMDSPPSASIPRHSGDSRLPLCHEIRGLPLSTAEFRALYCSQSTGWIRQAKMSFQVRQRN